MSLFKTIQTDMYQAMKSGEKTRVAALREVVSKLKSKRIDSGADLSESDELKVVQTLVKQHKESKDSYTKAGRQDLVDQEDALLEHLEPYLPQMMSEAEIRELVADVINETGASGMSDLGKVMPQVMGRAAGRADGRMTQGIVRELLS